MAVGEGAKVDALQPFPVKEQLPGVHFCVSSSPPWPEAILLGFQHYLVMLGTTVMISTIIVPLMGGGNVEKAEVVNTLLFVAGINTLLQTWFGTRLPVVIGGSYAFIIPAISVALSSKYSQYIKPHQRFKESMRALQGALIIGSFLPMVIGFFGFWRIFARFLSPLAAIPLVTLTGLGLYAHGFPQLANCIEVGLPALILVVLLSQYVPFLMKSKVSIFDRFAVLFAVAIVWAYAEILTAAGAYDNRPAKTQISCRTDRSGLISGASWIKVPYPFQWGRPTFNAGNAFAMMAASFVAVVESTGVYIAASRYGSATPVPPSVLSRGIGWQGVGILLDGIFGTGNGSTASVENAGLLGLTQVGSRRVIQISAGFMLFFSVLGKFGAVVASIPLPIVAALYCVLFAYVFQ
ncbi:nucleobase-ascorbate transporter 4 isoform X2 [Tripterygium wilfordii]|uniref:nucleobase-ascorbate transporter 4 isoform X2 n=1 Tax=Tripterygium wilfordii TaxID=458696 RepID=UPI0018F8225C|nr:nucleobase-ascorbate transporter 4 isoform X2 [Tripterygium wilfordii]